jgi:hypothetical protein
MNILEPVTVDDQYFGLIRLDLRPYWEKVYSYKNVLNPDSFKEYANMRKLLAATQTHHKFEWINSGLYLPDYVWLSDDTATFFKLKYGL